LVGGDKMTKCEERKKLITTEKGIKILARTIYRKLKTNGLGKDEIIKISSEIIGLITKTLMDIR
jgi:hypothetical protein